MPYDKTKTWDIVLLLVRVWLGYRLITASYSSITGILFDAKERDFFKKWFGEELHFPFPLAMAFLAKGAELSGGFFITLGLFTRPFAWIVAFTMVVATLTANLGSNFVIDGGFTISYAIFAVICIVQGGGRYSFDHLLSNRKMKNNINAIHPSSSLGKSTHGLL
jgi:uncharacterized membrane protein YphA (DoxX/SURF4 family)